MKKLAILCALPLLGSCGAINYLTAPRVKFVRTYCVTRAQFEELRKAQPEKIHSRLTGDAERDILTITANTIRLRSYSDGLLEVLGGCTDPKT